MRIARKAGVALTSLVMAGGLATATSGSASAATDEICAYPSAEVYNDAGKWPAAPSGVRTPAVA